METVHTLNGLEIQAKCIKHYTNGKLFFAQERLLITDMYNKEITSIDIINFVSQLL